MTIEQGDGTVSISRGDRTRTFYTDGRTETQEVRFGTVEISASMEGEELVIVEGKVQEGSAVRVRTGGGRQ